MAFEIERKFLVANNSWRGDATIAEYNIRQAYLTSHEKASVRVRIMDNERATLTIKARGTDLRRLELEYDIPVIEAEALLPLRCGAIIEKTRALVQFEDHNWEVDTFLGENLGLVIAEVELPSEGHTFARPPWLGAEVTGDPSYYNIALSLHPFSTWTGQNGATAVP